MVYCPDCRNALSFIDAALPVAHAVATAALLVGALQLGGLLGGGARVGLVVGCGLLAAAVMLPAKVMQFFRAKLTFDDYVHAYRD